MHACIHTYIYIYIHIYIYTHEFVWAFNRSTVVVPFGNLTWLWKIPIAVSNCQSRIPGRVIMLGKVSPKQRPISVAHILSLPLEVVIHSFMYKYEYRYSQPSYCILSNNPNCTGKNSYISHYIPIISLLYLHQTMANS